MISERLPFQRIGLRSLVGLVVGVFLVSITACADQPSAAGDRRELENKLISFRLIMRKPENIAAFYEARGFAPAALEKLKQPCFLSAIIRNHSDKVVWLELDNWRFMSDGREIMRFDRSYWDQQWQQLNVPMAHRSTFGWTQLPEQRDLQPHEPVGGSMALLQTDKPLTLEAHFNTGPDKQGEAFVIRLEGLYCQTGS